jgi:hypothetical protein
MTINTRDGDGAGAGAATGLVRRASDGLALLAGDRRALG